MDLLTQPASMTGGLPARRVDATGHSHVDRRAVLALALPLMANSAVQIVLNLTDMWFIGHISTQALAGVGAVQWLAIVVVLVLGGVGAAVQTIVAQSEGARRYLRSSQAAWTALWPRYAPCRCLWPWVPRVISFSRRSVSTRRSSTSPPRSGFRGVGCRVRRSGLGAARLFQRHQPTAPDIVGDRAHGDRECHLQRPVYFSGSAWGSQVPAGPRPSRRPPAWCSRWSSSWVRAIGAAIKPT